MAELVAAGLLIKKGKKRGIYYQRSEELAKQVSQIPPPKRAPDPFEIVDEFKGSTGL